MEVVNKSREAQTFNRAELRFCKIMFISIKRTPGAVAP
jgi:hypothetical protein